MAWIESHSTLRTHRKLKPLCDKLGISRAQAIGHLHMLWWWALDNREDGDLKGLFARDIAHACDWHGNPEKLQRALISTGWLTSELLINDWMDYAGRLINERIRTRKKRVDLRSCHGSDTGHATGQTHVVSAATVPNLTIPNHTVGILFNKTQEKTIKKALSERFSHEIDSEANRIEYENLVNSIKNDSKIKDPMAVAMHRALMGWSKDGR